MRVIVARWCDHPIVVFTLVASLLAANMTQADEPRSFELDSRVQKIPQSPFHGIAADGGILLVTQSRMATVGKDSSSGHYYLTLIKLPMGETLDKVRITPPLDDSEHAVAARDGSRIAIIQENTIELRDVSSMREVANRVAVETTDISGVALSNDGMQLAVGSRGTVDLFSCQTGERLHRFSIESTQPILFFSDLNQLGAFDETGVWLSESSGKPPELFLRTPEGFQLQTACVSNDHCFALLKKLRSGNVIGEIMSGKYQEEPYFVTKFDKQGSVKWQSEASRSALVVNNDTVVFLNEDLLVRTTASGKSEIIGRCEWLPQVKFSSGGEFLVGLVKQKNGFQIWNANTWKPHFANAIPFGESASAIDDNGRVTVTSQSSVCVSDRGGAFQKLTDLPDDASPYMGKHWLSGDGRLLAWLTKSDTVKLMNLIEGKEISIETRDNLKATAVWLNQLGDRAIIRYESKATSAGQAAQRGFLEGFFGGSAPKKVVPADLISLPTGERIAEFDTSDLDLFRHPFFPGERMSYSTMKGIAHFVITPMKVNRMGTIGVEHTSQSMSASGTLVVGTSSGKVLRYETPTSPQQILMQTSDDRILTVDISPDGKTTYCCEYDRIRRQTLLKVIASPDGKTLWEQWLPDEVTKLQVSPEGKQLLLTNLGGWYTVRADF